MKLIIRVIVAAILLLSPQGAGALCVDGDCITGQGTAVLSDGRTYVGEFREGVRMGRGEMTYADGTKYAGDWHNDRPHGKGTLTSVGTFEYRGEFANGVRHGQGILTTPDGKIYEGQWENDVPHGEGRIVYPGKEEFVGRFANGRRHGPGEAVYRNGIRYKGQWANDLPNGQGIKTLPEGMQYAGEFKNGLMYGKGSVIMSDGSRVAILWQSDVPGQKIGSQTDPESMNVPEKSDWYRSPTPGDTLAEPGGGAIASEEQVEASPPEAAAAVAAVSPEAAPAPAVAVVQIAPSVSSKKLVAGHEKQAKDVAPAEMQTQRDEAPPSPAAAGPDTEDQVSGSGNPPGETSAPPAAEKYVSIGQVAAGANIRAAASLSAEVLRSVQPGYPLAVLEQRDDWVLVRDYRERTGWVSAPLLSDQETVIIKVWKGNLRRGPNQEDAIISKLDHGTVLAVVGKRGNWFKVSDAAGSTGWIFDKVVWPSDMKIQARESAAAAPAPSRRAETAPAAAAEQVSHSQSLEKMAAELKQEEIESRRNLQVLETETPAKGTVLPAAPAAAFAIAAPVNGAEEYVSIGQVASGANIRAADSQSAEVLRSVQPGFPLEVLKRQGDWVLVRDFRERTGWVYGPLLSQRQTVITTIWKANLRRGPSREDAIIAKFGYGTVLAVVAKQGDWLKVSDAQNLSGWIYRKVVWP